MWIRFAVRAVDANELFSPWLHTNVMPLAFDLNYALILSSTIWHRTCYDEFICRYTVKWNLQMMGKNDSVRVLRNFSCYHTEISFVKGNNFELLSTTGPAEILPHHETCDNHGTRDLNIRFISSVCSNWLQWKLKR